MEESARMSKKMTSIHPIALHLEDQEREELQQLINRHRTPQQIALRASIIVLAGHG